MRNLRLSVAALAAICTLSLATSGCDDDDNFIEGASVRVVNDSDFTITEIFLAPVDSTTFGDNLLDGDVLLPGEELLLGVSCDTFDALIVDEAGVECELNSIDLCLNDAVFVIRNNTCTVFGGGRQANEEPEKATLAETKVDASR